MCIRDRGVAVALCPHEHRIRKADKCCRPNRRVAEAPDCIAPAGGIHIRRRSIVHRALVENPLVPRRVERVIHAQTGLGMVAEHAQLRIPDRRQAVSYTHLDVYKRQILNGLIPDRYDVLEAADGLEGLDMLRRYGTEIALVLLD